MTLTSLLFESSDSADPHSDSSANENERGEEPSIDDHLHAWAHGGAQWIIEAALPLDGELLLACEQRELSIR